MVRMKTKTARDFLLEKISDFEKSDPQQFWKLLNKLKAKKKDVPNTEMISWEDYSKELHNVPLVSQNDRDSEFEDSLEKQVEMSLQNKTHIHILDHTITMSELRQSVAKLKNNKSSGPDLVRNEMIKFASSEFLYCIRKLFNNILKNSFMVAWSYCTYFQKW